MISFPADCTGHVGIPCDEAPPFFDRKVRFFCRKILFAGKANWMNFVANRILARLLRHCVLDVFECCGFDF